MTGSTHRVGGMLCCLAGYSVLQDKGLLLSNVNPLLQLTVMYPFAIYGSMMSDLDHHWDSCPSKDLVSYGINKVLHLTTGIRKRKEKKKEKISPAIKLFDSKHRSWQTHSDLTLFLLCMLAYYLINSSVNSVDVVLLILISTGLLLGVISHLILDLLTPEGIWSILKVLYRKFTGIKIDVKLHIVPSTKTLKKLQKYKVLKKLHLVPDIDFFSTGGKWEKFIKKLLWALCFVLIIRLVYIISPYTIVFNF